MDNEIEYNRKKLLHKAKKYGEKTECKCGEKDWRVVTLHEYGDPFMPSSVILKCKKCKEYITYASANVEQAKAYATEVKKEEKRRKNSSLDDFYIP